MFEIYQSQPKQRSFYHLYIIIWFTICCLVSFNCYAEHTSLQMPQKNPHKQYQAIFKNKNKKPHIITLEVAHTDTEKARGLMFRKNLPANTGMVFIYDTPQIAGIWMKNTQIPLDIIFVNCQNQIVKYVTRQPHTTHISQPPEKICKIIEVNAGFIKEIDLSVNTKIKFNYN